MSWSPISRERSEAAWVNGLIAGLTREMDDHKREHKRERAGLKRRVARLESKAPHSRKNLGQATFSFTSHID